MWIVYQNYFADWNLKVDVSFDAFPQAANIWNWPVADISTCCKYFHWLQIFPFVAKISTGYKYFHLLQIFPLVTDISTCCKYLKAAGGWYFHLLQIFPLVTNISIWCKYLSAAGGWFSGFAAHLLPLPTWYALHWRNLSQELKRNCKQQIKYFHSPSNFNLYRRSTNQKAWNVISSHPVVGLKLELRMCTCAPNKSPCITTVCNCVQNTWHLKNRLVENKAFHALTWEQRCTG